MSKIFIQKVVLSTSILLTLVLSVADDSQAMFPTRAIPAAVRALHSARSAISRGPIRLKPSVVMTTPQQRSLQTSAIFPVQDYINGSDLSEETKKKHLQTTLEAVVLAQELNDLHRVAEADTVTKSLTHRVGSDASATLTRLARHGTPVIYNQEVLGEIIALIDARDPAWSDTEFRDRIFNVMQKSKVYAPAKEVSDKAKEASRKVTREIEALERARGTRDQCNRPVKSRAQPVLTEQASQSVQNVEQLTSALGAGERPDELQGEFPKEFPNELDDKLAQLKKKQSALTAQESRVVFTDKTLRTLAMAIVTSLKNEEGLASQGMTRAFLASVGYGNATRSEEFVEGVLGFKPSEKELERVQRIPLAEYQKKLRENLSFHDLSKAPWAIPLAEAATSGQVPMEMHPDTHVKFEKLGKNLAFTNCLENSLMFTIYNLVKDPVTGKINLEAFAKLKGLQSLNTQSLNTEMLAHFHTYDTSEKLKTEEAAINWAKILTGHSKFVYTRFEDEVGYDLDPSNENVVAILNELFGLSLQLDSKNNSEKNLQEIASLFSTPEASVSVQLRPQVIEFSRSGFESLILKIIPGHAELSKDGKTDQRSLRRTLSQVAESRRDVLGLDAVRFAAASAGGLGSAAEKTPSHFERVGHLYRSETDRPASSEILSWAAEVLGHEKPLSATALAYLKTVDPSTLNFFERARYSEMLDRIPEASPAEKESVRNMSQEALRKMAADPSGIELGREFVYALSKAESASDTESDRQLGKKLTQQILSVKPDAPVDAAKVLIAAGRYKDLKKHFDRFPGLETQLLTTKNANGHSVAYDAFLASDRDKDAIWALQAFQNPEAIVKEHGATEFMKAYFVSKDFIRGNGNIKTMFLGMPEELHAMFKQKFSYELDPIFGQWPNQRVMKIESHILGMQYHYLNHVFYPLHNMSGPFSP